MSPYTEETSIIRAGDFSSFPEGWTTWARDPYFFNAAFDPSETFDAQLGSLKVSNAGNREWKITFKRLIDVKPGEYFTIKAALKSMFDSRKAWAKVATTALDEGGEQFHDGKPVEAKGYLGPWRGGTLATCTTWNWRLMEGFFCIPEDSVRLEISLTGTGPGTVWLDALELKRGSPEGVLLPGHKLPPPRRYPEAVVYKKIPLKPDFIGPLRTGDLDGDGEKETVFTQCYYLHSIAASDIYGNITCITALDFEGNTMWQIGKPEAKNSGTSSDICFQVYDLDGDGRDEVLLTKDFEILLLDGRTGKVKAKAPTPNSVTGEEWGEGNENFYPRIVGDSITFCNLSGKDRPEEFIVKDRYNALWAYDRNLCQLWSYVGKLAHYVQAYDIDGDGREEVFTGDAMLDHNGKILWRIDLYDHCDSILMGEIDSQPGPDLIIANSDGGFYSLDPLTGRIKREWHLGHCQSVDLANFRGDIEGLEINACTAWGGQFWFMFNRDLNILQADFQRVPGQLPVNWDGSGEELILSSGGLYDGYGRIVVEFPEARHGGAMALDVYGDPRDEVIVWDRDLMVVYTQKEPFKGDKIYAPRRPAWWPSYGCFKSEPRWIQYKK